MDEKIAAVAQLLHEAGVAHHEAFRATNGDDPAWPLWYANYLSDKLAPYLGKTIAKDVLADTLVRLDQEVKSGAGDGDWELYYAGSLVNATP